MGAHTSLTSFTLFASLDLMCKCSKTTWSVLIFAVKHQINAIVLQSGYRSVVSRYYLTKRNIK